MSNSTDTTTVLSSPTLVRLAAPPERAMTASAVDTEYPLTVFLMATPPM